MLLASDENFKVSMHIKEGAGTLDLKGNILLLVSDDGKLNIRVY